MKRLALLLTLLVPVLLISQNCLPEGIYFETQEQIDNFQTDYPGCTEIEGNVKIHGTDIYNLNGLNVLSVIGGNLNIGWNDSLNNLAGLENLTSINGNIYIEWNGLTSLMGLEGLITIGGDFYIVGEYNLQDLNNLEHLCNIGGRLQIGSIGTGNSGGTSLVNLGGLDGLDSINGGLGIVDSGQLTDISALNDLNYLGGFLTIVFNSSLATCQSDWLCDYLLNPNGSVSIQGNAPGCNSIIEVGSNCNDSIPCLPYGNYFFLTQADIDNFQNVFPGCTELEGGLSIASGPWFKSLNSNSSSIISNLDGLNNITSIGGWLGILSNDSLINLDGLSSLTSVSGELFIGGNELLTTLSGLDNIDAGTITGLEIAWNASLSTCEVQSICDYLVEPGGYSDIHNNAPGCNTEKEVEEACETVSIDENSLPNLIIKPNPFTTSTTMQYTLSQPQTVAITFYNQFGKQVDHIEQKQSAGQQQVVWTPKVLVGVYYFRMKTGDQTASGKVVLVR